MPGKLRVGRGADLGDRTYFFEIIPDLLVITGFDGYMRDVNTAWQNAVGWSRKELLALPFLEFIHPEDRTRMAAELERLNVRSVAELAEVPVAVLIGLFGARGRTLRDLAHGIDPRGVQP
ncbi:MAG: PAS domain S-box protein, partial [Thermoplasmatota archaeon]